MNRLMTWVKGTGTYIDIAVGRPHTWTSRAFGLWVSFLAAGAFAAPATLTGSQPFRLLVDAAGNAQNVSVEGTNFENSGHPNRDEYMHWQIRRENGSWEKCGRLTSQCRTTGWTNNTESFLIGGAYIAQSGFVELRFFHGLASENSNDPSQAANLWSDGWSNVLRIPVVAPGSAPTIRSLSKNEFPVAATGTPDDYRFLIDASGVKDQGAVAVVFRGDVVVGPERIHDGQIQVSVPEVYRLKAAGELPLTLRTDKGGESARVYIRFKEPLKMGLKQAPLGGGAAAVGAAGTRGGGFVPRGAVSAPAATTSGSTTIDPKKTPIAPMPGPRSPILAATDYITPQGQRAKGEVRGNRFYLTDPRENAHPAPDGTYRRIDGTSIIVQGGGLIVPGGQTYTPGGAAATGGVATPGGVKAISPIHGTPAGAGAAGLQAGPRLPGGIREPGGIKAIGPKQDDPAAPGKLGVIAPTRLDASASPGTAGLQAAPVAGGSPVPGGIREPGGVKAIGPKQDDPAAPGKLGVPGGIAPVNVKSIQPQPMSQ